MESSSGSRMGRGSARDHHHCARPPAAAGHEKQAYAKLKLIHKELSEEVFLGHTNWSLVPTRREVPAEKELVPVGPKKKST